ncbi:MAG: LLM class flavin-dependent oxidoreductase [Nitriliruptoraceae bacterium]
MRRGLGVSEDLAMEVQADIARAAEAAGFSSLWTNEASGRDALLLCQWWAAATRTIDVGVGVVPIWTRSPAQLAMASATLQETSGGRFLLGLGVGHPATMGPGHGATYRRPLTATAELLDILSEIDATGACDVQGEVMRCERFRLRIAGARLPTRRYVAAMGPRMLELAGRRGQGVLLNWSDPDEIARAGQRVRAAAHTLDRTCEVAAYVRVAVADDRDDARAALATQVTQYARLDAYRRHFERQGHGRGVARALEARSAGADGRALAAALGDDVLDALGWAGSPRDASSLQDRFTDAGLDHLIARVVVVGDDAKASVDAVIACLGAA